MKKWRFKYYWRYLAMAAAVASAYFLRENADKLGAAADAIHFVSEGTMTAGSVLFLGTMIYGLMKRDVVSAVLSGVVYVPIAVILLWWLLSLIFGLPYYRFWN